MKLLKKLLSWGQEKQTCFFNNGTQSLISDLTEQELNKIVEHGEKFFKNSEILLYSLKLELQDRALDPKDEDFVGLCPRSVKTGIEAMDGTIRALIEACKAELQFRNREQ